MVSKTLNQFLAQKYPLLLTPIRDLAQFQGKIAAIDVKLFLYQFKAAYLATSLQSPHGYNGNYYNTDGGGGSGGDNTQSGIKIPTEMGHVYFDGFVQQWRLLKQYNITPIYVFDGEPPKGKQQELEQRHRKRQKIQHEMNQLSVMLCDPDVEQTCFEGDVILNIDDSNSGGDSNDNNSSSSNNDNDNANNNNYKDNNKYCYRYNKKSMVDTTLQKPNSNDITENLLLSTLKQRQRENRNEIRDLWYKKRKQLVQFQEFDLELLQDFFTQQGIYFVSVIQGDAEHACAYLVKRQWADFVITNDIDTVAYGASVTLRQLSWSLLRGRDNTTLSTQSPQQHRHRRHHHSLSPHVLYTDKILDKLCMSWDQFLQFYLLCGTDVGPKIPGIACNRAFTIISKYKSVSNFLDAHPNDTKLQRWRREHYRAFCETLTLFKSDPVLGDSNVPHIMQERGNK
jgi:5'-3' exonuclease